MPGTDRHFGFRTAEDRDRASSANIGRRRILTDVRDGLANILAEPLAASGFRFRRGDSRFRRESDGVSLALSLGVSSRPASLGGVGILIEPMMGAAVPAWSQDAERRLAESSGPLVHWESPSSPVVWEALDGHVPGRRPHWTLPDEPSSSDISRVAQDLRASVQETALPFLERLATQELLLGSAVSGDLRFNDERFTIACGALLAGRPDLVLALIEPLGTARRDSVAAILGLAG